jgi:hypothetical protein
MPVQTHGPNSVMMSLDVPWLRQLVTVRSPRRAGFAAGLSTWDLWWIKRHCDRFFSGFFGFPCQYHSTVDLHTHILGPMMAAVQRQYLNNDDFFAAFNP